MLNIMVATIRDVQHHLRRVLTQVASGHAVEVTRHGKVVAVINPPPAAAPAQWPDFAARLKRNFPKPVKGKPLSQIIIEEREDRL